MQTTHEEFQAHYRYISHVIDFLTAFQDGRRILEETSQNSIDNSEYPESPKDPESPHDPEGPVGPDDPEGPEPWWLIK